MLPIVALLRDSVNQIASVAFIARAGGAITITSLIFAIGVASTGRKDSTFKVQQHAWRGGVFPDMELLC